MFSVLQAGTSGLIESFAQVAMIGATLVLLLMLVALGGFAYKSLRGDGIEWPDDVDAEERDGAVKGSDDDEWDYY